MTVSKEIKCDICFAMFDSEDPNAPPEMREDDGVRRCCSCGAAMYENRVALGYSTPEDPDTPILDEDPNA